MLCFIFISIIIKIYHLYVVKQQVFFNIFYFQILSHFSFVFFFHIHFAFTFITHNSNFVFALHTLICPLSISNFSFALNTFEISLSHTLNRFAPYGYVVVLSNVCNLLSSLLVNTIFLTSSVYTS